MEKPSKVFGWNPYDPCMTKGCLKTTMHKSGYCQTCRQRVCSICGAAFIASQKIFVNPIVCGACRAKSRKPKE